MHPKNSLRLVESGYEDELNENYMERTLDFARSGLFIILFILGSAACVIL